MLSLIDAVPMIHPQHVVHVALHRHPALRVQMGGQCHSLRRAFPARLQDRVHGSGSYSTALSSRCSVHSQYASPANRTAVGCSHHAGHQLVSYRYYNSISYQCEACQLFTTVALADKGGDPELLRESQRRRYADVGLVDKVIELDQQWRQGAASSSQQLPLPPAAAGRGLS